MRTDDIRLNYARARRRDEIGCLMWGIALALVSGFIGGMFIAAAVIGG